MVLFSSETTPRRMRWVFWSAERRLPFKAWDGSVTQTQAGTTPHPPICSPRPFVANPQPVWRCGEEDTVGFGDGDKREK